MKRSLLVLVVLLLANAAAAEVPFQFSVPGFRGPDDPHVNGVRLSILYGSNQSVRGVDFGILSLSETSKMTGFSSVFGVGQINGDMTGFANSLVNLHTGIDTGLNAAFFNRVHTVKHGANVAFVNVSDDYTMIDIGALNVSEHSLVQVGGVNMTRKIRGVQIGFLNFAENGFLPIFPFFNFPKN